MGLFAPLRWFAEWWSGLSAAVRIIVPLVLLAISTILYFTGVIWIWGWVMGGILLMFGGPSESEKKGYRF